MTVTEAHTTPPRTETRTEYALEGSPGRLYPSYPISPDVIEIRRAQYNIRDRSNMAQLVPMDAIWGVWPRILTRQATRATDSKRTITATPWTVHVDKPADHDTFCHCWDNANKLGHEEGCCFQYVNDKGLRVWRDAPCHSAEHAAAQVARREENTND